MSRIKVYKRGGAWRVNSVGIEWWEFATWREAFDLAFDLATQARDILRGVKR